MAGLRADYFIGNYSCANGTRLAFITVAGSCFSRCQRGPMRIEQQTKLRIERFIAASLLLIAAIVSGADLLHMARAAEAREFNAAANNYSAVRKIYTEQS